MHPVQSQEKACKEFDAYKDAYEKGEISKAEFVEYQKDYDDFVKTACYYEICGGKHNIIKDFDIDEIENTEVKFGETLTLTANPGETGLPEGCKVVDAEGNTVTDEYGKDAVASQVLTMLGYVPYATIAIDEVETTEVKFGETLTLTANLGEAGLPEGCKVEWTVDGTGAEIQVSEDTLSCTVKCVDSGEVTVTATVVDAEGNTVTDEYGKTAVASQVLTMLGYVPYATIAIDEVETTEVKFGETLTLTANLGEAGLPEGCKVEWTVDGTGAEIQVSEDTLSCTVKCVDSGEVTVTAKVVDAEGNTVTDEYGKDAVASQTLTMNANFFVRVEAFFKYLWNLIVSLFK